MKNITKLLTFLTVLTLCGCSEFSSSLSSIEETSSTEASSSLVSSSSVESSFSSSTTSINTNPSRSNPITIELTDELNATPTKLVGPFTILDPNGEVATVTIDWDGSKNTNLKSTYTNMYEAIRIAGKNSTSKNALQVQDSNFVQIYKRIKATSGYVFDGEDYVGTAASAMCKNYCRNHPRSYAVNGTASDYLYLGRDDMVKGQSVTENVLETYAGAYNYMFSRGGSGGSNLGYRYATADVLLSETKYVAPTDGGTWNAYIFINMAEGISADLGLIGVRTDTRVEWWLFRSCGSKTHVGGNSDKDAPFHVFQKTLITYSTKYDSKTKTYSGFDDLHFETAAFNDGWWLEITNMRTKQKLTLDHHHKDASEAVVEENKDGVSTRVLIASSFCPVTGNVWNWKCGAALNNVVWTNISLKKAIKKDGVLTSSVEDYRNATESFELYPDSPTYRDGYSQGAYCSSHEFSTFKTAGQSAGGFAYSAGQKYISYSVDYR